MNLLLTQLLAKANISYPIYPNPTRHKIFIDLPDDEVYQVSLTDISGKVMKQIETEKGVKTAEMNLSNLLKGMFLVEVKSEAGRYIQKLVIE